MLLGRRSLRRGMRRADAIALVSAAYRFLLGREPDEEGLASYARALEEGRSATWLLEALGTSDEHRNGRSDRSIARL
jgi:hypothetical protein